MKFTNSWTGSNKECDKGMFAVKIPLFNVDMKLFPRIANNAKYTHTEEHKIFDNTLYLIENQQPTFFSTFFYVDNNNILNTQNRICMNRIKKIPFVMERIKEIESRHYLLPVMILWVRLPSPLFWYLFKNSR